MDTAYEKCLQKLIEENERKGYLLFADVITISDMYDLSLTDLDRINEDILIRGVKLFENEPLEEEMLSDETTKDADYSRVDYESVYSTIIKLAPELNELINYIQLVRPPQHGELQYLLNQIALGNCSARERMISMYLRNVCKTALWYSQRNEINIWDAISTGTLGLINAVDSANLNDPMLFKTTLNFHIQNAIARDCSPEWMDYYFPVHVKDNLKPEFAEFLNQYEIDSYKDIDWSVIDFNSIYKSSNEYLQMALIQASKMSLEEIIEKESDFDIDEIIEKSVNGVLQNTIESLLDNLSDKEKKVIKLRFGFGGEEPMTLEQVGEQFGVTRERIRQIEVKAKRKIEQKIRHNKEYRWLFTN